jgi:hypothetical protein
MAMTAAVAAVCLCRNFDPEVGQPEPILGLGRMRRILTVFMLLLAPTITHAKAHYTVVQSVAVPNGHLEVLLDARLAPDIRKAMLDKCVDPEDILEENDPRLKPLLKERPLAALFRQVDIKGRIITSMQPNEQAPVARIEAHTIGNPADPVFLLDTNDSACMGSYSGRGVLFYHFDHGRITPVMVNGNGKPTQIYLFDSLKSEWRFLVNTPTKIEIEQMLCRPDYAHNTGKENMPFLLRYITFRFDGGKWTQAERLKPGFWEADDNFPPRRNFP